MARKPCAVIWSAAKPIRRSAAVAVFSLNVAAFPTSANTYDSLGEANLVSGDTTHAIANYRRSLALNPGNTNAADVERYLIEGKPGYMGPWITFTKPQWTQWGRLAEHLRTKDLKVMGSIETFTVADARRYHDATYSIGLGAGRRFVRQVDLSGRKRIMDIGGGSGAYCIAAAKEHAAIRAVVLDLPVVCEVARDFIAANGVADRVEAQACNFTRDPFPADCDVAIMASNLPMYGRDMIASVIRKAHDALLPGGQMHLIGEMTNDQRTGPWGPAYWGLGQAVSDSLGLAHSEADVTGYFRTVGFLDVGLHDFIAGSLGRVTGTKAG